MNPEREAEEQKGVKSSVATESRGARNLIGQTNPTFRKLNAAKEKGRVLPQSEHGRRSGAGCGGAHRAAAVTRPRGRILSIPIPRIELGGRTVML